MGAAFAVVGAAAVAVFAADLVRMTGRVVGLQPVADTFGIVATALFFGAGVLRYARWRITGEAYMAASSAALLVFALATFPMAMAARTLGTAPTAVVLASLARAAAALVVAVILGLALRAVEVDSRLRPRRLAIGGIVAALTLFVGVTALLRLADAGLLTSALTASALEFVGAAVWLMLASLCARVAWRRRSATIAWSSASLAMIGMAAVMRSVSRAEGMSWLVAAGGLTVAAAWASGVNAVADVHEALADESDELLTTTGALADAERLITDVEARRRELVHDARSMIGALRAASTTLDRHAQELDAGTTQRLRDAMDLELERLGRLIEGPAPGMVRPFDVASALAPGIALLRSQGLAVTDLLESRWVVGRPDDLAHVVHNVIVNARRHAPGSPVTVRCEDAGDTVRVHVEDSGPGVPAELVAGIFDRGVTSEPDKGEGLGLYLARRLMREQGGDLALQRRAEGGADFVVSLPASSLSAMGQPLADVADMGEPNAVSDVDRVRRPRVCANGDPVPVVGESWGEHVGERAQRHIDRRPELLARPSVGHGDEPVTAGASVPRLR